MIFASLVIERDPLRWQDFFFYTISWVQNVGGFAAIALLIWAIMRFLRPPAAGAQAPMPGWQKGLFRLLFLGAMVCFGALLALKLPELFALLAALGGEKVQPVAPFMPFAQGLSHLLGGACALLAVLLPFLADLPRYRWRRIWALASLSFKEAVRRRILWVFTAILVVLLFAGWFVDAKSENQVRSYVTVVYWAMTPIFLVTSSMLAAFSLPTDIKNQTIHTIVTKPVERFEVILGRFLGFMMLMTVILFVMTAFSLLYVVREIDPDARAESMRARIPLYGTLEFKGKEEDFKGVPVGREWDYRRYVTGTRAPWDRCQRAIWSFDQLPANLATRSEGYVPCEFAFDIFRTLKGEEGKGVFCSFLFQSWRWDPKQRQAYEQERDQERRKPNADLAKIDQQLAEKYGVFEVSNKEVADYHTDGVKVPAGLFKNAFEQKPPAPPAGSNAPPTPLLQVLVKCDSGGQYLGMARHDFYLLDSESSFHLNFMKGAIGLWLRMCLVVGIAVVASTYLSGVIAWLLTILIFVGGYFQDYILQLAQGRLEGGGPFEAFIRLVKKENLVIELEKTPDTILAQYSDDVYRWIIRRVLAVIPDVDRLDWTQYVAEGFNIGFGDNIVLSALLVVGYLLPCALVGYYLMKWREIASS